MKKNRRILSLLLAVSLLFSSSALVSATGTAQTEEAEVVRLGEVESLRETNSQTYLLSDGSYECVVYAEDKFYLDESDTLQLIDNSIKAETTALSTTYTNTANVFDVTFSDSGAPEVSISLDGKSVTFSPLNASSGTGNHIVAEDCAALVGKVNYCQTLDTLTSTGSNTVTYEDAFTNTDLVYVLENHALKEYIILNSASAPNEFSFLFSMEGLTMQTVDGKTYFADEDGESVFGLADLFAIDAENALTEDVTYSFVPVKGTTNVIVTITLDEEYLTAPERVFPVVIDPSFIISSYETADTWVCSYYPDTNYYLSSYLRTGMDTDYGIRRSFIRFDIPSSIPEDGLLLALLDIEKSAGATPTIKAHRCIGDWTSSTLTWNNQPLYNTTHEQSYSSTATLRSEGSTWYRMVVTDIVKSWTDGLRTNYGFAIVDSYEFDTDYWTTFYSSDADSPHKPELYIYYTETPEDPDAPTIVDAGTISVPSSTTRFIEANHYYKYAFTPSATDKYSIWTTGSKNTSLMLYSDSALTTCLRTAEDGGHSTNACMTQTLSAGHTYYIVVKGATATINGQTALKLYRGLPMSGSEKPKMVSEFEQYKNRTNCYTYALAIYNNYDLETSSVGANPGDFARMNIPEDDLVSAETAKQSIEAGVRADLVALGGSASDFFEVEATEMVPEGYYKVFLALEPGCDYHWYRQVSDANGAWAHKLRNESVRTSDSYSNTIYDPYYVTQNMLYKTINTPLGYYAIKVPEIDQSPTMDTQQENSLNMSITLSQFSAFTVGVSTQEQVKSVVGKEHSVVDSGCESNLYNTADGYTVLIRYQDGILEKVLQYSPQEDRYVEITGGEVAA